MPSYRVRTCAKYCLKTISPAYRKSQAPTKWLTDTITLTKVLSRFSDAHESRFPTCWASTDKKRTGSELAHDTIRTIIPFTLGLTRHSSLTMVGRAFRFTLTRQIMYCWRNKSLTLCNVRPSPNYHRQFYLWTKMVWFNP